MTMHILILTAGLGLSTINHGGESTVQEGGEEETRKKSKKEEEGKKKKKEIILPPKQQQRSFPAHDAPPLLLALVPTFLAFWALHPSLRHHAKVPPSSNHPRPSTHPCRRGGHGSGSRRQAKARTTRESKYWSNNIGNKKPFVLSWPWALMAGEEGTIDWGIFFFFFFVEAA